MHPRTGSGDARGASAVEMALLLPVLLLVMFGIIEFGRYFYLESMAASVASDAAREASLPGATDSSISALVLGKLNNGPTGNPPGYGLGVTPAITISPAQRQAGDLISVSFSYPYDSLILPHFAGLSTFPASITAGASATVEP